MSKNHTTEKITALQKYVDGLKARLNAPVTCKHKDNPEGIKNWLKREIEQHTRKLEDLKMYLPASK